MFAQGPIIDSDPAPGRSPGPPVNSSKSSSINQFNDSVDVPSTPSLMTSSSPPNDSALFLGTLLPDDSLLEVAEVEVEAQKQPENNQQDQQNNASNPSELGQGGEIQGGRSSMNNSSTTPRGTTIKDASVSNGNKPRTSKNKGSVSTSSTAWPRNRRSNGGKGKTTPATTTMTPPDIVRIAVATVESSDQDDYLGQVNLFCGDTPEERRLRERRYASEPDDVIVKLQSSEVFWGLNKSESGMKGRDGNGDTEGKWRSSDNVDTNTTEPSLSSVNEGDVTSYPDHSSSSSSSIVTTYSSPNTDTIDRVHPSVGFDVDDDVRRGDRVKDIDTVANDKGGGNSGVFEAKDGRTRDHGVPVRVDVTHDVFDSRFGLVAGVEYRGKLQRGRMGNH